jgi:hypothetical protein
VSAVELDGPEIVKIGWSSGSLVAHDMDGDDRIDLAVVNNDRARIELLLQRDPGSPVSQTRPSGLDRWQPVLEDARFERSSIATGNRMFALSVGDLDNNGHADVAYTGTPHGLTVRYQNPRGDFDRERVFDITEPAGLRGTVVVSDVDSDALADLVVLTKTQLLVYRQSNEGALDGPEVWRLTGSCYALEIIDVDGDGHADISYQLSGVSDSLRVRHGLATGGFGPETAYTMSPSRGVVRSIPSSGGMGSDFVRIQADTGLIERLALEPAEEGETVLSKARARVFAVPVDGKAPAAYAVGDLDGNGFLDVAVADPRGARIWVVRQVEQGIFSSAEEFPSLADVRSLVAADRDGDGRSELIMASPRERTLAWTRLDSAGALQLPTVIDTRARPLAVVAADFDSDGHLDLAYASAEKRERHVVMLTGSSNWLDPVELEVEELETDPEALRAVDLDGDGRLDLVLFVSHEAMRLLVQDTDGVFREIGSSGGIRTALIDDVDPSSLTLGDVTGDGVEEMIISSSGFARALRLDESNNLEVVGQFNARSNDATIAAASILGTNEASESVIALLEPANDRLQVLTRRRDGVWRFSENLKLPPIDLVEARVLDLDGSGTDDLVLFGADRFVWLPVGLDDPVLSAVSSWECDLQGVSYQMLGVGDLDADGQSEVIAVDSRDSHVLEVLRPDPSGAWASLLHFTVFEVDPHYEGQRGAVNQPREIVIADLTDDGLDDLALVVHDRVLVYPQVSN